MDRIQIPPASLASRELQKKRTRTGPRSTGGFIARSPNASMSQASSIAGKVARKSDFSSKDATPAESPITALTRLAPVSPCAEAGNGFRSDRVTFTMTCGYRCQASIPQAEQAG